MLPKLIVRSLKSKNGINFSKLQKELPTYTLNKNHGKFFYSKLLFIEKRFESLLDEIDKRGYNLKPQTRKLYDESYDYSLIWDNKEDIYGDWSASESEMGINRERIAQRISERVGFYRYYGERID